jgi:tyrosine-protein kinase Etk/Wzc
MSTNQQQVIDLRFLRRRDVQRRIATVVVGFGLLGALYGALAPKWYRSILTVVPSKSQKSSGIAGLLSGDLGALGGVAAGLDGSLGSGADAARIAEVLKSNGVSDAVIDKFDLRRRYGEKYQESTREALWTHCDVKILSKPGLVVMSCEDWEPQFVQEMLLFFADHGNQVFRRVSVSSASEEVRYLERRIAELKKLTEATAARVREFQEKHKIVDLEAQAKALVTSVAALDAQRIMKEMELEYARSYSSSDEATNRQLETQLSVVDQRLRDLETPRRGRAASATQPGKTRDGVTGLFPAALAVPALRAEFETLYRDRKVAEATLVFALDRLEGARAAEARDVSTFQVLDPPSLPTRRSRPRLSMTVGLAVAAGLAAAVSYEFWRRRREQQLGK